MTHYHSHRRLPRAVSPAWLFLIALPSSLLAWPFWWLWAPLGYVVCAVVYALLWAALCAADRRSPRNRRVVLVAEARARVRSPRG